MRRKTFKMIKENIVGHLYNLAFVSVIPEA